MRASFDQLHEHAQERLPVLSFIQGQCPPRDKPYQAHESGIGVDGHLCHPMSHSCMLLDKCSRQLSLCHLAGQFLASCGSSSDVYSEGSCELTVRLACQARARQAGLRQFSTRGLGHRL